MGAEGGNGGANGTVVVIEDDHHISDLVALYLRRDGFRVLQSDDGAAGLAHAERERARLVIVDVGLPGEMDGFEVCRALRQQGGVPVVMLTARDDEVDRVLGPRARGRRLRHQAVLRPRAGGPGPRHPAPQRRAGPPRPTGARAWAGSRSTPAAGRRGTPAGPVALTTREFDLLAYLAANRGLALSRRQLLDGVWGEGWYGDERTVDVHVRQLRKKLGDALPLTTVWGVGYRLG